MTTPPFGANALLELLLPAPRHLHNCKFLSLEGNLPQCIVRPEPDMAKPNALL